MKSACIKKCKHCENFTSGETYVNYYSFNNSTGERSQGNINPIFYCPACGRNLHIADYRLPVKQNMFDMCFCTAKCSTPCGRKQKSKEKICTTSDFTEICTSFKEA